MMIRTHKITCNNCLKLSAADRLRVAAIREKHYLYKMSVGGLLAGAEIHTVILLIIILFLTTYFLFVPDLSFADIFYPMSEHRKTLSLDGQWKFNSRDSADFSSAAFDDSVWQTIRVPGSWTRQGIKGIRAGWYRKKFTVPNGSYFALLRFDRILDSGEVWLNGEKLINPKYQPPLEEKQFGVYGRIWTFDWPEAFQAGHLLQPGKQNTIAVRVVDDPITSTLEIASRDDPTFRGEAGITGSVYLIGHNDIFIRTVERTPPKKTDSRGMAVHIFSVVAGNTGMKSRKCFLRLAILSSSGAKMYEKTESVTVDPSGKVVKFKWFTQPSFETYRAIISINDDKHHRDKVSLRFHGTMIEAAQGMLNVNGQPFRIKGIEGLPGLIAAGKVAHTSTFGVDWMKDETAHLKDIGINTIRIENPPQSLMKETQSLGIMVIPVIRGKWDEMILALREYPNILYWDIDSEDKRGIEAMASSIVSIDVYSRPIAYSGSTEIEPADRAFKLVNLKGLDASHSVEDYCEYSGIEAEIGMPAVLIHWGGGKVSGNSFESIRFAPALQETWKECIESNLLRGAIYANLYSENPKNPGLRNPSSPEWNPYLPEIISSLFDDFKAETDRTQTGGYKVAFTYTGLSPAKNIRIIPAYGKGTSYKESASLLHGQTISFVITRSDKTPDIIAEYETNGGMPNSFHFVGDRLVLNLDMVSIVDSSEMLSGGKENQVKLILVGGSQPRKIEISLEPERGTQVQPTRRGVSVPADDRVDVPFTVIPPANVKSILLTAVIRFSDSSGPPMKSYLVMDVN
jgi:hypothetical protein